MAANSVAVVFVHMCVVSLNTNGCYFFHIWWLFVNR